MKKYRKPIPRSKFIRVLSQCDPSVDLVNSRLEHMHPCSLGMLKKSYGVVKGDFVYFKHVPDTLHYSNEITYWRLRVKPKVAYIIDKDYKD